MFFFVQRRKDFYLYRSILIQRRGNVALLFRFPAPDFPKVDSSGTTAIIVPRKARPIIFALATSRSYNENAILEANKKSDN